MELQFPLPGLRENVYATIVFFDIFDFPLTMEEIQFFFLGKRHPRHVLQEFLEKEYGIEHAIINSIKYYFLKGRSSIVHIRLQRKQISARLWKKVQFFLPFIQMVPFIKMVAVCNTLAFDNATKDSDIDLFIVARRNRLFIVRFFTLFLFSILGVRRHGQKVAGRFCLSFYVDEDFLNLELLQLSSKDIYFPFWMIAMKPLYGERYYHRFMAENQWLRRYFQRPVIYGGEIWKPAFLKIFGGFWEFLLKRHFGNWVEKKFYSLQQKRHQKNISALGSQASVIVEKNILKFHNFDRRREIQQKFWERLRKIISLI